MRTLRHALLACLAATVCAAAQAPAPPPAAPPPGAAPKAAPKAADLGLFVYPAKAQQADKQSQDENECYGWARQQTNIDPTAPPTQAQAPDAPKGGAVKGAARGAAKGAAVGAVSDERHVGDEGSLDAGEGAAAGATVGAVKGRRAQKKAEKQAKQQADQTAKTQDAQAKETFKKAWGACLEGRGYTVK